MSAARSLVLAAPVDATASPRRKTERLKSFRERHKRTVLSALALTSAEAWKLRAPSEGKNWSSVHPQRAWMETANLLNAVKELLEEADKTPLRTARAHRAIYEACMHLSRMVVAFRLEAQGMGCFAPGGTK